MDKLLDRFAWFVTRHGAFGPVGVIITFVDAVLQFANIGDDLKGNWATGRGELSVPVIIAWVLIILSHLIYFALCSALWTEWKEAWRIGERRRLNDEDWADAREHVRRIQEEEGLRAEFARNIILNDPYGGSIQSNPPTGVSGANCGISFGDSVSLAGWTPVGSGQSSGQGLRFAATPNLFHFAGGSIPSQTPVQSNPVDAAQSH